MAKKNDDYWVTTEWNWSFCGPKLMLYGPESTNFQLDGTYIVIKNFVLKWFAVKLN
jgi:hypothetical protein